MTKEEEELKKFFTAMRREETQHAIPEFESLLPQKKGSKIRYLLPVGIAAMLLVGFGIWTENKKPLLSKEETVYITIGEEEKPTDILLPKEDPMMAWESSTTILINDFND